MSEIDKPLTRVAITFLRDMLIPLCLIAAPLAVNIGIQVIICCQRARARVCVCRCVCVYTLPRVGFFRLHDVFDISEKFGSMISYCEYSGGFCEVPSSLFLNLFYFTSKDENSSHRLLERKRYNTMFGIRRKDDIYWYTI